MPRAFSEHERESIGKRLVEQGYRLFSSHGLKKTNIEEIAVAAGISKGAFYSFYESKEALFMDVIELTEERVREQILAVVDLPGPSARARLFAVLKKAFDLFRAIPILQFFTSRDFDLLFQRIPAEKLQEHMTNDQAFIDELIAGCRDAGIPIQVQSQQIMGLLYPLVPAILRDDGLSRGTFSDSIDKLLELVAAFCLGEVELRLQKPTESKPVSEERKLT